jgi:hypothetical protein
MLQRCSLLAMCAYPAGGRRHVETSNGVEVLFSRGCSFYTLNEQGQVRSHGGWPATLSASKQCMLDCVLSRPYSCCSCMHSICFPLPGVVYVV